MKIIGLSGTNGSGKDTVAQMLVERHNYYFASATYMLKEELEFRGWPTDRTHKSKLSAEWRREYGMAVIVERAWNHFKKHKNKYKGLIIASLRHPSEAELVHELGGKVVWVDADPEIRYQRIQANASGRGRAAEDNKTFEEFIADEYREMHPEGDEATLNMAGVKNLSDITLLNNGHSVEAFKDEAEKALKIL